MAFQPRLLLLVALFTSLTALPTEKKGVRSFLCNIVASKISGIVPYFFLKNKTETRPQKVPASLFNRDTVTELRALTKVELPNFEKMNDFDLLNYITEVAHVPRTNPPEKIKYIIEVLNALPDGVSVQRKAELWEYFGEALSAFIQVHHGRFFNSDAYPSTEGTKVFVGKVQPDFANLKKFTVAVLFIDKDGFVFQGKVDPRIIKANTTLNPADYRPIQ